MSEPDRDRADDGRSATFSAEARGRRHGTVRELAKFLRDSKKWWLTPIVLSLLLLALIVVLGGTAAAPWLYTLF